MPVGKTEVEVNRGVVPVKVVAVAVVVLAVAMITNQCVKSRYEMNVGTGQRNLYSSSSSSNSSSSSSSLRWTMIS